MFEHAQCVVLECSGHVHVDLRGIADNEMDGCPLGLGLVVEDKPTEFSCSMHVHVAQFVQ